MRKLLLLFFILNIVIYGQDHSPSQDLGINSGSNNGWGFKAGLNIAKVGGDDVHSSDDVDNKYGFNISIFSERSINPNVSFQWEIQYSAKGWNVFYEDFDSNSEQRNESSMSLNYIEVPLVFKFYPKLNPQFMLYFNMGGVLGFNVSAKYEYDYYYYYDDGSTVFEDSDSGSEDISDEVEPFEFGLLFGAGFKIPTQTGNLLIDFKYNFGMTNIPDESNYEISNRVFLLSLGFQFVM